MKDDGLAFDCERQTMKVLVISINYAPEDISTGYYSGCTAEFLEHGGHDVTVISAPPYYPSWRVFAAYRRFAYATEELRGVRVQRCPLYVPADPTGLRRLLSLASFTMSALPVALFTALRRRPDVVISISPSLMYAPLAVLAARLCGALSWLHIQDLEVDAAVSTGLLRKAGILSSIAFRIERALLRRFDRVSTISEAMAERIVDKGTPRDRLREFRNWAEVEAIQPDIESSALRRELGIDARKVVLYSGNMANKQGLEVLPEAARLLAGRDDLQFVICGEGPARRSLVEAARDLPNVTFVPLQPRARLPELLSMAALHVLPQIPTAADLVLPSKLANMLASGRPVIATAAAGTTLAHEIEGAGCALEPGRADLIAAAVEELIDDPTRCRALGARGRQLAEERWSRERILARFECELAASVAEH